MSRTSPGPTTRTDTEQIARAREVFARQKANRWNVARTGARERKAKIRRLKEAVLARRQELYDAMHQDFGRPATEAEVVEVYPILLEANHALKHLDLWMRPRRVGGNLIVIGTRSEVRFEPRGATLILCPWNYPVMIALTALIGAIAAGNCVILRPSEKVPATGAFLDRLLRDLFPEDEIAVVEGDIPVANALLDLPFDHIFFTGSTAVGRRVMQAAAAHLTPVTLELGGKSPVIIDETADLSAAAERVAWGKFMNAGQTCVAPDYVLVQEKVAQPFLERMSGTVARFYGHSSERSPDLARIVDQAAFERLRHLLQAAVADGATVVTGGQVSAEERRISPTVLAHLTSDSPLMQEEIFGPILPVLTYRNIEEVLSLINARPRPLALYIFSRDHVRIERILGRTESGGAVVNGVVLHLGNPNLPFGGVGESGMGAYHGHAGFLAFSHQRAVLFEGPFSFLSQFFPPYRSRVKQMVTFVTRLLKLG